MTDGPYLTGLESEIIAVHFGDNNYYAYYQIDGTRISGFFAPATKTTVLGLINKNTSFTISPPPDSDIVSSYAGFGLFKITAGGLSLPVLGLNVTTGGKDEVILQTVTHVLLGGDGHTVQFGTLVSGAFNGVSDTEFGSYTVTGGNIVSGAYPGDANNHSGVFSGTGGLLVFKLDVPFQWKTVDRRRRCGMSCQIYKPTQFPKGVTPKLAANGAITPAPSGPQVAGWSMRNEIGDNISTFGGLLNIYLNVKKVESCWPGGSGDFYAPNPDPAGVGFIPFGTYPGSPP